MIYIDFSEISKDCNGYKLIFIMDEWDALFHMSFIKEEDKENYLLFLKSMLKGKPYVELSYMTGILPIAKYSDGSELNMFDEYDMASKEKYSEYFGFLDEEVDQLYQNTKDQIYSAMVVYGLLTYEDGKVFIPNKELIEILSDFL